MRIQFLVITQRYSLLSLARNKKVEICYDCSVDLDTAAASPPRYVYGRSRARDEVLANDSVIALKWVVRHPKRKSFTLMEGFDV